MSQARTLWKPIHALHLKLYCVMVYMQLLVWATLHKQREKVRLENWNWKSKKNRALSTEGRLVRSGLQVSGSCACIDILRLTRCHDNWCVWPYGRQRFMADMATLLTRMQLVLSVVILNGSEYSCDRVGLLVPSNNASIALRLGLEC